MVLALLGRLTNIDESIGGSGGSKHALLFLSKRLTFLLFIVGPALYLVYLSLSFFSSNGSHYPPPYGRYFSSSAHHHPESPPPYHNLGHRFIENPHAHFRPPRPEEGSYRAPDVSNTFENYRHVAECKLDSRDLHHAIEPLCPDKASTLDAMSWGGRAGFDQPYIPFGCDFRWYTTEEICQILDRFSHIFIIGDSLQRMIVTALYMLLREDVGLGGVAEWDFEPSTSKDKGAIRTLKDCMCEAQFNRHECSHSPVRWYTEALETSSGKNRPVCGRHVYPFSDDPNEDPPFDISYHEFQQYPTSKTDLKDMLDWLPSRKPEKPFVFIMHHTFWNVVNITATTNWIDDITENVIKYFDFMPRPAYLYHYPPSVRGFPRLFVTANAAGVMKNAAYLDTQNSGAIARFESAMQAHLRFRGIDMLGFFNMSVQTTSSDGTHANMRTNLLKAMMVINWLDWTGKEETASWPHV